MAQDHAVATRIRAALASAPLKRDIDKVRPGDDLRKDLGLDSLAMIELLFKIEETFDLEIPNEDLSQIATVGDVIAYVERLGAATAAPVGAVAAPAAPRPSAAPAPGAGTERARPAAGAPSPPNSAAAAAPRERPTAPVAAAKRPVAKAVAKKKGSARA